MATHTSSTIDTIWSSVTEEAFRTHVVSLEERTNAVPIDVQKFGYAQDTNENGLPLQVEQQVVDDLAFIAAAGQGAQSVAAVCIEQIPNEIGIIIRFAAADTMDLTTRNVLQTICHELSQSQDIDQQQCSEKIFSYIIETHQDRLLARLRSKKWLKPKYLAATHKKPLWQDFEQLSHRVQHVYPARRDRSRRAILDSVIGDLSKHYQQFEESETELGEDLHQIIKKTYDFCLDDNIREMASILEARPPTPQISAVLKTFHQLEKIGSYWRIAQDLVSAAICHPRSFAVIRCDFLKPYDSTPTEIAYESWAKTCHVHAEVQLIVDCDLRYQDQTLSVVKPRAIGTSKYLCYLCHLFVLYHGVYVVTGTHGRIFDQWT